MKIKQKFIYSLLIAGILSLTVLSHNSVQGTIFEEDPIFVCTNSFNREENSRVPTTMLVTNKAKYAVIYWTKKFFKQEEPYTRCQTVTSKFQKALEQKKLWMIANDVVQNKEVICIPKAVNRVCEIILMEFHPEESSKKVLNYLKDVFNGEQVGTIQHNGGVTKVYYRISIDNLTSEPLP